VYGSRDKGTLRKGCTNRSDLARKVTTVFARAYAAPRFLGQKFGNNNSYISRTMFHLCESKIFAIAIVALWLSLVAFTVICQ
jgi:hypothetical protein